jgi:aromatic ring-cleaving dioxygenase
MAQEEDLMCTYTISKYVLSAYEICRYLTLSDRQMRNKQHLQRLCGSGYEESVCAAIRSLNSFPTDQPTVPELRIYRLWDKPIGPHPVAMFEVNLFTPAQFGAFIPWLVINRGPLSALVHPNTDGEGEHKRNHTQRATWLGERLPLDLSLFN